MTSQVSELEEEIAKLQADIEELEDAYGLDEEEPETIEVPAGGRTNHEQGVSQSFEVDDEEPETVIEEVEIPAGGRTNESTATVEREVPVDSGMDTLEWRETLNQSMAEEEQERVNQRREAYERHIEENDDDREVDTENVPAGGRSNWENRQNQREKSDDVDVPAGGRSNWEQWQEDDR